MEPMVVAGLLSSGANLAWQRRAAVVALDPGVEPAAADPPGFEGDRPVPRAADGVEVRDDVIVAVVGVVLAVIHPADDPAGDEEVRALAEAHRTASGVAGRVDPDGELVRAVVPDLDLVEGDVGRVDDHAERECLAGPRWCRRSARASGNSCRRCRR